MSISVARSQPNQISSLRKTEPIALRIVISTLIESLLEAFNVKNNMNPAQVADLTKLIIEEFWFLRPEEIMFAFKQAKSGIYGVSFNRLDAPTILIWIRQYVATDRWEDIEKVNSDFNKGGFESNAAYDIYAEEKKRIAENGKSSLVRESEKKRIEAQKQNLRKRDSDAFVMDYFEEKSKKQSKSPF